MDGGFEFGSDVKHDDDDASHCTWATFSEDEDDEDDWVEFSDDVDTALSNIKRNSPILQKINVHPYSPTPLDPERWIAMGSDLGRNTHLRQFIMCADGLDEGDEIHSKENWEAFCRGLSRNRSLALLMIEEYDFSRVRLSILHPLVVENNNLVRLILHQCNLDKVDMEGLADAFRWRKNPSSIRSIEFTGRSIGDGSVNAIVQMCMCCPRLKKLDLSFSNIGNQGCIELATLLQSRRSHLKSMDLSENPVGNEGGIVLAKTLNSNSMLRRLSLDGSTISATGLEAFQRTVGNTASITATYQSNHTLESLCGCIGGNNFRKLLPEQLQFCLQANRDTNKAHVARKKILYFHLKGSFNLVPFIGMDTKVLPTVLGWIGKDCDAEDEETQQIQRSAFYRILRNVPKLCGHLSPDRKPGPRLLEKEIAALKHQNARLLLEIEELRSDKRRKLA